MIWRQYQKGGDSSQNIQAAVANFGLGYDDVVSIVSNYVEKELQRYSADAFTEARRRVEELTINYLEKIRDEAPKSLKNTSDPAIQASLLDAQTAYAKSGSEGLGKVLVNLLSDRTKSTNRGLQQLALSAAIACTDRMSDMHLKLCSAQFFATTAVIAGPKVPDGLYEALRVTFQPFIEDLKASTSDIGYLLDIGVIKSDVTNQSTLIKEFLTRYPGLFCKGLESSSVPHLGWHIEKGTVNPSPRTPGLLQITSSNASDLAVSLQDTEREEDLGPLSSLLLENPLTEEDAFAEMSEKIAGFQAFATLWEQSNGLRGYALTVTGLTVAHANSRAVLGSDIFSQSLDTWVS